MDEQFVWYAAAALLGLVILRQLARAIRSRISVAPVSEQWLAEHKWRQDA